MKEISSILSDLRRPFKNSEVDWKVQSTNKDETSALVVAFIDARDVAERLNRVCPGQWSNRHDHIVIADQLQGVTCTINVRGDDGAISVEDVGIGEPLTGDMKPYERDIRIKTYWSDAFKRAAVKLGVASSLYDLPQIWLNDPKHLYKPSDKIRGLTNDGKANLAERYERWVNSDPVRNRFGAIYEW